MHKLITIYVLVALTMAPMPLMVTHSESDKQVQIIQSMVSLSSQTNKPFILPFSGPPGPDNWYLIQYYGNTQGAYRFRDQWYRAGQGLHFGLDFAARCRTPVLAIGDGEVAKVDGLEHGSGPHNLLIRHDNGLISLYGHLYQAPQLLIGQRVEEGEIIGLSGDPDQTCRSRPHLHLEIRSGNYGEAYNPIDYIGADWDGIALFGPLSGFQRDLRDPRNWQDMYNQPAIDFWGPMLNDFDHAWPPAQ